MARKKRHKPEIDLDKFLGQLSSQTDTACAIVGAAFLDARLEDLCRQRFAAMHDELFDFPGPLSSFSSRINVAHSLSWIDKNSRCDLDIIRAIRNEFAHGYDHELSFESPLIKDRCCKLRSANAFFEGFAECAANNPKFSKAAIESMKTPFSTARGRFQIAVDALSQFLQELPLASPPVFGGPDFLAECYGMSANIRLRVQGRLIYSPPKSDNLRT